MIFLRCCHQDIVDRISAHDKQIGFKARLYLTAIVKLHKAVCDRCCAFEGVNWRHATVDHIGHLHRILAMEIKGCTGICTHGNLATGFIEHLETLFVLFKDTPRFLNNIIGNAIVCIVENVLYRREGWYEIGSALHHRIEAFLIHKNTMFNRGNAGFHRVHNSLGSLCMARRCFVKAPGLIHTGMHFFGGIMRIFRVDARRHDATSGHDFDKIAAGMNLFAHGLDDLVASIRNAPVPVSVAARHADHFPRGHNIGAKKPAAIAGIADGKLQILPAAAIADRRNAGLEGELGVF